MATVTVAGGDGLPALDPEAVQDLLDVLDDVSAWRLAPARWERVDHILETIASAVAARDVNALIDATTELELASPVRVHRIGASEIIPVPPTTRDRTDRLVHILRTGEAPPATERGRSVPEARTDRERHAG